MEWWFFLVLALEIVLFGVLLVGVWMIFPPAAFIVGGAAGIASCELWSRQLAQAAARKAGARR